MLTVKNHTHTHIQRDGGHDISQGRHNGHNRYGFTVSRQTTTLHWKVLNTVRKANHRVENPLTTLPWHRYNYLITSVTHQILFFTANFSFVIHH